MARNNSKGMALEDDVSGAKRAGNPRPVRRIRISPGAVLLTGVAIAGAFLIYQALTTEGAPLQNVQEPPPGQGQLYTTPAAEPTATIIPTAQQNIQTPPVLDEVAITLSGLRGEIREQKKHPPELQPELTSLASIIESTLGVGGYDKAEAAMVSVIGHIVYVEYDREGIKDFGTILLTKSYRSQVLNVDERNIEVVVLSSDPDRAPLYFDIMGRVIPKVEQFTGLKYGKPVLVIYSTPSLNKGSFALNDGIETWYPEDPNRTVRRSYETTTQKAYLEETIAHEFDHVVSLNKLNLLLNLPTWLLEGKAEFTMYHALRSKDGLPVIEEPFQGYLENLRTNVTNSFKSIPPISEHDGQTSDKREIVKRTVLGELLLQDILVQIGPENMAFVMRDINSTAEQQMIDRQAFYSIVLAHTPENTQPQMTKFLQERYEGLHPETK